MNIFFVERLEIVDFLSQVMAVTEGKYNVFKLKLELMQNDFNIFRILNSFLKKFVMILTILKVGSFEISVKCIIKTPRPCSVLINIMTEFKKLSVHRKAKLVKLSRAPIFMSVCRGWLMFYEPNCF